MIHTNCPEQNRISEYLRGILPEDESGGIAEHLEHCTKCDSVAEQLEQADHESDWLVRHLGMTTGIEQSNEHALDATLDYPPHAKESFRLGELHNANVSDEQLLTIGNYHIEQIVGRGGMGIVCRATHVKLNKTVALKVIASPHLADAHNRFEREMRAIGGLHHDAIVQATDAGCIDGRPFLAMQFVEGIDLAALLKIHGPLSIENACEIARQAAIGLQFAHDQNTVHRDIKPSNIMLDADGRVKILDFGLAQMQSASSSVTMATSVGQLLGTLDYLAPEQTDGSNVDARADVYSLAATLYALLTGRPPLGGSADQPVLHHLRKLVSEKPQPIDEIRDDAPLELTNLLQRALETEPDRRNLSARQFADSLQRYCEHADLAELVPEPTQLTEESAIEHQKEAIECLRKLYDPGSLFQNSMPVPAESKTLPGPKSVQSAGGRFMRYAAGLLIALALIGGSGYLGIVLYLETGEGRLKIKSEAEDIRVTVLKDDEVVDEIEVSRGEKEITIRAGRYEVRVQSESDEVKISQDSVRVFRGDEAVLVVTKVPQEESAKHENTKSSPAIRSTGKLADESSLEARLAALEKPPLWQNRRPEEWLVVLRQERDEATRVDAVNAIIGISEDLPPDLAAGVLFECGSATLDAYVNNDQNKVPDVVIAMRKFWTDETLRDNGAVYQFVNDEILKSSNLLAKKAASPSAALGKLSIETLRAQIEPTLSGDNQSAKAMLLRALVGLAFSSDESDQLTADLLIEHGGESGMTSQVARAIAAVMMHNEDGVALLRIELKSPVENSNHAALLLRLARKVYPDKISDDVLLDVLARTCADSDYDTAMRLYGTQQLWPPTESPTESATQSLTKTGDAFAAVLLPLLEDKLKLEDFGKRFINSEQDPQLLVHFTLLVRVLTDHRASPIQTDRVAAFLDRAIDRIASARNDFELKPSFRALVEVVENSGTNFSNAVELYVCLTGLLPDSLKKPVKGNGDLVESLRHYETVMAGKIETNPSWEGHWAETWFPHQSIRSAVNGLAKSPDGDSTFNLHMRYSHMAQSAATAFATALELQGTSEITDELLIQLIVSPSREPDPVKLSKLRYSIRAEMDVCDSHLLSDYWIRLKQHPKLIELAMRMFDEAKSDRLKTCALAIFCANNSDSLADAIKQYSLAEPLWRLILSDDNVASLYAILWAEQAGLLKGHIRSEEVVQRLSRDGFAVVRSPKLFLNQRLHFLDKFDDASLKSISESMTQSLANTKADSYPRPAIVDVRGSVESDHAPIQLAEICARFPGEGKKFRAELEDLNAAVSDRDPKYYTRHHKQRFSEAIAKLLDETE